MEDRYLRLTQIVGNSKKGIAAIIPVGASSFWLGIKQGRYPQPIKLGPKTTVWLASEIYALVGRSAAPKAE